MSKEDTLHKRELIEEQVATVETSVNLLAEREAEKEFYSLPTGPATNAMQKMLTYGTDDKGIEGMKRSIAASHDTKLRLEKSKDEKQLRFIQETGNSSITLEITDIDKLVGTNKPAKKIFPYTLIQIGQQALNKKGELQRDYVVFSLQDLIDIGLYKTKYSARRGFKQAMGALTSMKASGEIKIGRKALPQDKCRVLFTGYDIIRNTCTVYLNYRVNWTFIAPFYTILPRYYFKLSNRAADLLLCIFIIARMRKNVIAEKSYFTISMRKIQGALNLPSEKENREPNKTIRVPIEQAIEEIEIASNNKDFTITPMYDERGTIKEFLDKGYLKIGMSGKYAQKFKEIANEENKRIATAAKHKETIIEKAEVARLAKAQTKKAEATKAAASSKTK